MRFAHLASPFASRMCCGALLCLGVVPAGMAATLGRDLTLQTFVRDFAAGADFDQEATVRLSQCSERATPHSGPKSIACRVAARGTISGLVDGKRMRDLTLTMPAVDARDVVEFQRASKYFVTATQPARVPSAGALIAGLMRDAMGAPEKASKAEVGGVRYTATLNTNAIDGRPAWSLTAESAAQPPR